MALDDLEEMQQLTFPLILLAESLTDGFKYFMETPFLMNFMPLVRSYPF